MITIFVAKLDFGVSENELFELFKQYGTVAKVTVAKDKETNKSRGFAFVEMPNRDQAQQAIDALDGYSFNGRKCAVKEAENRSNTSSEQRGGGQANRFENRGPRPENRGGRDENRGNRDEKKFFKPRTDDNRPKEVASIRINDDNDDEPIIGKADFTISDKPSTAKKKKEDKPKLLDNTADGKNKKQKMDAYKKSGKDNIYFEDEDEEDLDLFGRNEEEEEEEDYRKYLVNQDDEDEEWDEDEDEDWDEDDEDWDDEDDEY